MNKIIILLVTATICIFSLYFLQKSKNELITIPNKNQVSVNKKAESKLKNVEEQKLNIVKPSQETQSETINIEKQTSIEVKQLDENKIREDVLASFFDKQEFEQRTDGVFERYENQEVTPLGLELQLNLQQKVYSSGFYDDLKEKNIEFSDVECKMSLCKFDFHANKNSEKNSVEIVRAIATKIIPSNGKANISSQIKDGKISFYVGRGYLIEQ